MASCRSNRKNPVELQGDIRDGVVGALTTPVGQLTAIARIPKLESTGVVATLRPCAPFADWPGACSRDGPWVKGFARVCAHRSPCCRYVWLPRSQSGLVRHARAAAQAWWAMAYRQARTRASRARSRANAMRCWMQPPCGDKSRASVSSKMATARTRVSPTPIAAPSRASV
jgi:hypothetical protein